MIELYHKYIKEVFSMIIKPSASLRNKYTEISDLCHKTNEPIFITRNGEGDLVLMSIEKYERMQEEIKLLPSLIRAEQQIENGEYYNLDEIKSKMNNLINSKVAEESEKYEV